MSIQEMIQAAQTLSSDERQQLMDALVAMSEPTEPQKTYRISDLRGVGAELWRGVDAQEYVNQLRDEWDNRP